MTMVRATRGLSRVGSPASLRRAAGSERGLETGMDQLRREPYLRVWHAVSEEPEDHRGCSDPARQFSHGKTTSPNTGRVVFLQAAVN